MDNKEMKKPVELTDEQLEQASGGAAISGKTVGYTDTCEHFVCCWCGRRKMAPGEDSHGCEAQGHGFVTPTPNGLITMEAVFANTCENCEYRYNRICRYGM